MKFLSPPLVLRAVQFMCKTIRTRYSKKLKLLKYDIALNKARKLCIREDDQRKFENYERKNYASLLSDICEEGDTAKAFLCAVRDLLGEEKDSKDEQDLDSIELLKAEINNKVALLDSKTRHF